MSDYVELTGDDIPYHLRPDAQPLAVCSACHRETWAPTMVGQMCHLPQPDGTRCIGVLIWTGCQTCGAPRGCPTCGAPWTEIELTGEARHGGGYHVLCHRCGAEWDDPKASHGEREARRR